MFENGDVLVGPNEGMVVISNEATILHLTPEQAHWLSTAGIPATLMQLRDQPDQKP